MLSSAKNLVTGAVGVVGGVASSAVRSIAGKDDGRSEAAKKAAATRQRDAQKRSETARKAAATRKAKASARSASAKKAATTRKQRDDRVQAMVDATKRD